MGAEDKKVVLFIDILGFGNLIENNTNVTDDNCHELTLIFPVFVKTIMEYYSQEYQEKKGFKFLWASDTIVFSTDVKNSDTLIDELIYLENQFYCGEMTFRGCICVGHLFHENNIWGEALVRAAHAEKYKANYPRVIVSQDEFYELNLSDKNKECFVVDEEDGELIYFKPFLENVNQALENNRVYPKLKVYSGMLCNNYEKASENAKGKWVWMMKQFLQVIRGKEFEIDKQLKLEKKIRPKNDTFQELVENIEEIITK